MSTCPHCNGDGEEPGAPVSETETATCSACHGTGSAAPQHTPGAIRAARAIQAQIGIPGTVDALASIIDQETAAPDLLEALQDVLDSENSTLGDGGSVLGDDFRDMARAAIAKATPIQPRKGN